MGGDAGPGVVMAALSRSLVRHPTVRFLLHGDEALLKPLLAKRAKLAARAAVRHSAEQVRMDDRPAIAALWPTKRGQSVVLDVGANIATDSQQLVDFAVMGEAFARAILGLERPIVGLLNVGAEDVKANDAVRGAAQILRGADPPIEFCGFA